MSLRLLLAPALLVAMLPSCGGGSAIEGTWKYDFQVFGVPATATVTFNGDGTASEKFSSSSCTGAETYSGYMWSSTSSTLTFSGAPSCSGTVTCTIAGAQVPASCSSHHLTPIGGTCEYVFSNGNNTLTLDHCTGSTSVPEGGVDAGTGASTAYTFTRTM